MNEMARTWASARQYPETMRWLSRIADLGVGLDPSRDRLYRELHGTREFDKVLRKTREATEPVSNSRLAFRISRGDLAPESAAYDSRGRRFYFGSMRKGVIIRCDGRGGCSTFASGLGTVLGLKVHDEYLWAVSNQKDESALVELNLRTGHIEQRYLVSGRGHALNDIAISADGDLFATDTPAGAIWKLPKGRDRLEPFLPERRFRFANGIAIAPDGSQLYASNYPDGITVVDLRTGAAQAIAHPAGVCLALMDGLYAYGDSLIAIQNSSMTPRVALLHLSSDRLGVERMEILERRNRWFEGITGGTIAGNAFYYAANVQDEKEAGDRFDPIVVLKVGLQR